MMYTSDKYRKEMILVNDHWSEEEGIIRTDSSIDYNHVQ